MRYSISTPFMYNPFSGNSGLKSFFLSWNPVPVILYFKLSLPTWLLEVFLFPLWHLCGCSTWSLHFRCDTRALGQAGTGKANKYCSWVWTSTKSLTKDVGGAYVVWISDIYFSHLDNRTITTWYIWLLPWGSTQNREPPGMIVTYSENHISVETTTETISFRVFFVSYYPFLKKVWTQFPFRMAEHAISQQLAPLLPLFTQVLAQVVQVDT